MIFLSFNRHKDKGKRHRHQVRDHDGDPNAVDVHKGRQDQNRADLENKRTQERNERGGQAVVQCGKEARAEDRKAHENK